MGCVGSSDEAARDHADDRPLTTPDQPATAPDERPPLVCITGLTASGKSALALELAERLPAGILSVDSMQVYRGFDLGTAKPTAEEQARVPHFGIDLCAPDERFSAGAFLDYARAVLAAEQEAGRIVLAVGGTGLYLRALLHGLGPGAPADLELRARLRAEEVAEPGSMHRRLAELDPPAAARLHPHDLLRLERALEVLWTTGRSLTDWHDAHRFAPAPFRTLLLAIRLPAEQRRRRIEDRIDAMLRAGWLAEVERLVAAGATDAMTPMRALGYRELAAVLRGELSPAEARQRIAYAVHRFAKQQAAWFNREPGIHWVEPSAGLAERLLPAIRGFLAGQPAPLALESP